MRGRLKVLTFTEKIDGRLPRSTPRCLLIELPFRPDAEQRVDRSRLDHFVGLRLRYEIAKSWTASVGYDVRLQDFLSKQRFDTTHRNRQDLRQRVRAAIEWDFAKRWSLEVGGQWTLEEISRAGLVDEDDEETEYDRFVVFVALTVQLFLSLSRAC